MRIIILSILLIVASMAPGKSQYLVVNPQQVDFGITKYKNYKRVILSNTINDYCFIVDNLDWSDGGLGFSVAKIQPRRLSGLNSALLDLEFTPIRPGVFHDTLIIHVQDCRDGFLYDLKIPVTGEGLCFDLTLRCEPDGPLCVIDENLDHRTEISIQGLGVNPYKEVIFNHNYTHRTSIDKYKLSFDYLFKITGLDQLVTIPNAGDVEGIPLDCIDQKCLDDLYFPIKFDRWNGTRYMADFSWKWEGSGMPVITGSLGKYEVIMELPLEMSGISMVTPTFVEFQFLDANKAPHLVLLYDGTEFYRGEIACFNTTKNEIVFRHPRPGATKPYKHLIIKSQ